MPHPLDDEDLRTVVTEVADSTEVWVTIVHIPTSTTVTLSGTDEQAVRKQALDDLLEQLETISG